MIAPSTPAMCAPTRYSSGEKKDSNVYEGMPRESVSQSLRTIRPFLNSVSSGPETSRPSPLVIVCGIGTNIFCSIRPTLPTLRGT